MVMNGVKTPGFHVKDLLNLHDKHQPGVLENTLTNSSGVPAGTQHADLLVLPGTGALHAQGQLVTPVHAQGQVVAPQNSMPEITDLSQSMAVMTSAYDPHENPYSRWLATQDGAMTTYYHGGK